MDLFEAIRNLLAPTGYTVYDTEVPTTPTYPYVVVWGGIAAPHPEQSIASDIGGVRDRLGVTVAAGTPTGARISHAAVRALLQPGGFPIRLAGFRLKLTDHQGVQVDRGESIIETNRHPAYAVDIFRVEK
mgnify:CR=1 FL=1